MVRIIPNIHDMHRYAKFCLFGLFALGGCATAPPAPPSSATTSLQHAFLDSAQEIASSLRVLQEERNAKLVLNTTPAQRKQEAINADHLTPGLDKPISLDWHGNAKPVLALIGHLTKFGPVRAFGQAPQGGSVVEIHAHARPAYDVIRDIGAQLGVRAGIRVIPAGNGEHGVIELHWHGRAS